ncbi:MAG: type I DNA topoisomerase [Patescibacteria group bacterium]|nr:type I DNA topoisomerase [Patescibacteria group bacterium]
MPKLVIVESPTKARTITRFLPKKDYIIESSYGHIRDLPKAELGVDVENNFEPKYIIPTKAKKQVSILKKETKKADSVILATDEDREGEAIAWHLVKALDLDQDKADRIVFHEITEKAILNALKKPRKINLDLVDAQQARRILDRLVGYKLSPFLWKKIRRGLSAGRVQSVAVRLIVDKEREREKFKEQEYWQIEAELKKKNAKESFLARLIKKDETIFKKLDIKNKEQADKIVTDLNNAEYLVSDIIKKEIRKSPTPPFTTSTLQQEASKKLGYSAKQTMMLAQQLYEGINIDGKSTGLITYMRTDSVNLAEDALAEAKNVIEQKYSSEYSLSEPRRFKTKSKGAQEAHEAIRPTSFTRIPDEIQNSLDPKQYKLYRLIWQRALACQMQQATLDSVSVDIKAKNYTFRSNGSTVKFAGFLKVYAQDGKLPLKEVILPELTKNEILDFVKLLPGKHMTEPPARYSEATLIKALEEQGIGRPSTYAPTLSTIQLRNYVTKDENRKFYPTEVGILVDDLLVKHFPQIVDIKFTALMEESLDKIAEGEKKWQPTIKEFYDPFAKNLKTKETEVKKFEEETGKKCPKCGKPVVIKYGRFGKFQACSGFPECKFAEPIESEKKEKEELEKKYAGEKCEKCNSPMIIKQGRFGQFLACSKYPECKTTKPIEKTTGVKCPKCGKGDIIEKRSKRGKTFFACNQYPKCKNAYWSKPTGEKCPKCQSLLIYATDKKIKCSSKECDFTKDQPEKKEEK